MFKMNHSKSSKNCFVKYNSLQTFHELSIRSALQPTLLVEGSYYYSAEKVCQSLHLDQT